MSDTLTHLPEHTHVDFLVQEVHETLTPGGHFVLSFRDYSQPLEGDARFIAVHSDERRILTCFLEYEEDTVVVHDILHERAGDAWETRVRSYRKLRLAPERVIASLETIGFETRREPGPPRHDSGDRQEADRRNLDMSTGARVAWVVSLLSARITLRVLRRMLAPPLYVMVALASRWRHWLPPRLRCISPSMRAARGSRRRCECRVARAAISAVVAGLHLAGRLGVEQLWFRPRRLYATSAIFLLATAAWFRLVDRPLLRLGIPAAAWRLPPSRQSSCADDRSTPDDVRPACGVRPLN
jgi:hypothetical protein